MHTTPKPAIVALGPAAQLAQLAHWPVEVTWTYPSTAKGDWASPFVSHSAGHIVGTPGPPALSPPWPAHFFFSSRSSSRTPMAFSAGNCFVFASSDRGLPARYSRRYGANRLAPSA